MKNALDYFIAFCISLLVVLLIIMFVFQQKNRQLQELPIDFLKHKSAWADSLVKKMSTPEKLAQLFILEAQIGDSTDKNNITKILKNGNGIAGIRFKTYDPINDASHIQHYQKLAAIPLLISAQLKPDNDSLKAPLPITWGGIDDTVLWNKYIKNAIPERKNAGINFYTEINITIADSAKAEDNFYSYGENTSLISRHVSSIIKTCAKNKLLCSVRAFRDFYPVKKDSVLLNQNTKIHKDTFFAFQQAIAQNGLPFLEIDEQAAIQHANKKAIDEYLKKNIGFKGLILSKIFHGTASDSGMFKTEQAGIDVFIVEPENYSSALNQLQRMVDNGDISKRQLNRKVKRVLLAKSWTGLAPDKFSNNIQAPLMDIDKELLYRQIFASSFTLLKNEHKLIPFNRLHRRNFAFVSFGNKKIDAFHQMLNNYLPVTNFGNIPVNDTLPALDYYKFRQYNMLIVALNNVKSDTIRDKAFFESLKKLDKRINFVIVNLGDPSHLKYFDFIETIVHADNSHPFIHESIPQALFGGLAFKGKLAVSINKDYPAGHFLKSKAPIRFAFSIPEALGMDSKKLAEIDSIVYDAIEKDAMPGCQVLVIKNGKIVYNKAFGYHTYSRRRKVLTSDLYDLASITKVAATTLAYMRLFENKQDIKLTDSIKYYMPDTTFSKLKNLQFRELFIHQTGLPADMPVLPYIRYRDTLPGRLVEPYKTEKDSLYAIEVAKNFYLRKDYIDTLWYRMNTIEPDTAKPYIYSDINFNLLFHLFTFITKKKIDRYVDSCFYNPLGLHRITYLPLKRYKKNEIVPTEDDKYWRKQILQGYVHDPSAAIYGGVAGNAGLFANAFDLAAIFQALLNRGYYGGIRIFNEETVDRFTSQQPGSKRGLGFNYSRFGAYGHTGFTGNCVWANPKNRIIYVFLSNRIHPSVLNRTLQREKVRSRIHRVIYQAFENEY